MIKKITATFFALILFSTILFASAAGGLNVSDWNNLSGYTYFMQEKDTKIHKGVITKNAAGINYKCDGYYKIGEKAYSGMVLNEQINADNFSMEFKVNKTAGDGNNGDDLWVGIGLFEKNNSWDTLDPAFNQGFVTLIRPLTTEINLTTYENVNGLKFNGNAIRYTSDERYMPTGTFKIELKKNADNSYNTYFNGKKLTGTFTKLKDIFVSGKAYLYVGTSTDSGEMWDITVTKVNGQALNGAATTSSSQTASTSNSVSTQTSSKATSSVTTSSAQTSSVSSDSSTTVSNSEDSSSISSDTSSSKPASTDNTDKKKNNSFLFIIIGIVVLLAGAGVGIYFFIKNINDKSIV